LRAGLGPGAGPQQAIDEGAELETQVDSVLRFGKVTCPVLLEIELIVSAMDRGLEVGNEGVDPFEHPQVAGLAWTDDDGAMLPPPPRRPKSLPDRR